MTTARPGGISFEISPFKNSHDLLSNVNDYSLWFRPTLLNDTKGLLLGMWRKGVYLKAEKCLLYREKVGMMEEKACI